MCQFLCMAATLFFPFGKKVKHRSIIIFNFTLKNTKLIIFFFFLKRKKKMSPEDWVLRSNMDHMVWFGSVLFCSVLSTFKSNLIRNSFKWKSHLARCYSTQLPFCFLFFFFKNKKQLAQKSKKFRMESHWWSHLHIIQWVQLHSLIFFIFIYNIKNFTY